MSLVPLVPFPWTLSEPFNNTEQTPFVRGTLTDTDTWIDRLTVFGQLQIQTHTTAGKEDSSHKEREVENSSLGPLLVKLHHGEVLSHLFSLMQYGHSLGTLRLPLMRSNDTS